jgi:YesN/AraC family two-component response regulator
MNDHTLSTVSVLYVEDDAVTREEISLFLTRRAQTVIVAKDGAEGLELFRRHAPDIVLTDIRMPLMDGLKMGRSIRRENKGIPIIVTSAYSDTPYMLDAIDIGIDQYVMKPIDTAKLESAFNKSVEIIEYRRAHKKYLAEREQLITELQTALAEIKTLRGVLPICSYCKKIRDEKGAWTQLEWYIKEHSNAEFSHGLCQECAVKMYPNYFKEKDPAPVEKDPDAK